MYLTKRLTWTLLSLFTVATAPAVLAERIDAPCTDYDGDGFFYESDCGTLRDCNDASPTTYPGAVEACDGFDNECTGLIDDSAACSRTCDPPEASERVPVTLEDDRAVLNRAALVRADDGYGMAWVDRRSSLAGRSSARRGSAASRSANTASARWEAR